MHATGLGLDDRFLQHLTGYGHPERPERLMAIRAALEQAGLVASCRPIPAERIADDVLHLVHAPHYVERVAEACRLKLPYVDSPDSAICPDSYEIARLAAGLAVAAAREIAEGRLQRAFVAVRPPGHHAEHAESTGFCLFNNIALAARWLCRCAGAQRVLIVDFDVHHGNGTQHTFEDDPAVLFISLHGHPDTLYPGTGHEHELGRGHGQGFTLNLTFQPGATDADYRRACETRVLPRAEQFAPEYVLISAGFDAHAHDPLGSLALSDDAFEFMTAMLIDIARRHAGGRLLSVLEGGYNLDVLRRCVPAHVQQLADG